SPPMSELKLRDASIPLRWKKCSLPCAASINPKPRSDTTFLIVPVDTEASFALEHGINARSCSRERVLTTAGTCDEAGGPLRYQTHDRAVVSAPPSQASVNRARCWGRSR